MASSQDNCELVDKADIKLDPKCELFRGDPELKSYSALNQVWLPLTGTFLGGGYGLFNNWMNMRPVITNAPRTALYGIIGCGLGFAARKFRYYYTAEKDLMVYHYMTLHPEDFQAPERVKYRDYLTAWAPIR